MAGIAGRAGRIVPTTKPATEENDSFRVDWNDQLRGINVGMLTDAINFARTSYWRDISYKTLLTGGLKGMQAVATTPGPQPERRPPAAAGRRNRDRRPPGRPRIGVGHGRAPLCTTVLHDDGDAEGPSRYG